VALRSIKQSVSQGLTLIYANLKKLRSDHHCTVN